MNAQQARQHMRQLHQARAALVADLMIEGEEVLDSGLCTLLQLSERGGRGYGEGVLLLTTTQLLYAGEANPYRLAIALSDVADYKVRRSVPKMRQLDVRISDGTLYSFVGGKNFVGVLSQLLASLARSA